jgi:hypothetical protein
VKLSGRLCKNSLSLSLGIEILREREMFCVYIIAAVDTKFLLGIYKAIYKNILYDRSKHVCDMPCFS